MQGIFTANGLALSFVLAGCALFTPSLDERGIVDLNIVQREHFPNISFVRAYRSSDQVVIRGRLSYLASPWANNIFPSHMDVTVEKPNEVTLRIPDVDVIPKRRPKQFGRAAYFVARVATDTPRGTRITVRFPDEPKENSP